MKLESMLFFTVPTIVLLLEKKPGTGRTWALDEPESQPEPRSHWLSTTGSAYPGIECKALHFKWGELLVSWPLPQLFCRPSYSLSSTLGRFYLSCLQTIQWKLPSLLLATSALGQRLSNCSMQWNPLLSFWKHRWPWAPYRVSGTPIQGVWGGA